MRQLLSLSHLLGGGRYRNASLGSFQTVVGRGQTTKHSCDTRFPAGFSQLLLIFHGLTFKLKESLHFQEFENKAMCEIVSFTFMLLQAIGCIPFSALRNKNKIQKQPKKKPQQLFSHSTPKCRLLIFSMYPCCFDLIHFRIYSLFSFNSFWQLFLNLKCISKMSTISKYHSTNANGIYIPTIYK